MAGDGPNSGQQFRRGHRLHQVIQGPRLETLQFVPKAAASREDEHGCFKRPLGSKFATKTHPIPIGKLKIQYQHIDAGLRQPAAGLGEGVGVIYADALGLQVLPQAGSNIQIIFYEQYAKEGGR